MSGLRFRRATSADLTAMSDLDRRVFGNPWPAAIYGEELRRPFSRVELALEETGRLRGLSCSWVLAGEGHLLRLIICPSVRRRGIGWDLLSHAIDRAQGAGCRALLLEVARGNVGARGLYARAGFEVVGLRKGYYREPPDDALVLRLALPRPVAARGSTPMGHR